MSDVTITVPARPEFVHVLRSVIASVAARAEFTYDEIDDVRLAVDECCAQLFAVVGGASLTMRVRQTEADALEILTTSDGDGSHWPPPGAESTLTWQVLQALADEARFEQLDGTPALRLIKRRTPAGDRP